MKKGINMPIPTHTMTAEASIDFQNFAIDAVKHKEPRTVANIQKYRINPNELRSKQSMAVCAAFHKNEYARHGGDTRARLRAKLAKQ